MEPADWFVTVRVRMRGMCVHSEEAAADTVRWVIDEENGFAGLCDWPADYEILSIEPATADSASAVQPERCCLDYPRCDCNSPPEPDNAPTLQPCGHPWKAQHDSKCILCSSPGPAHEECLGCSSPTTCEKYGCSVKRQRAIDSASEKRDATSAQLAEEQRFIHGAAAVTGLTQQDYDALVRDAMLWRTRSPTGAGGNARAFVCCEGVGQHALGCTTVTVPVATEAK